MALTVAVVDAIRADLAALPPKDESAREVSRLEAIVRMRGEVIALRERGYSWQEVAEVVSSKGCRVTAATLKTELSRKGPRSRSKKRERPPVGSGAERPGPAGKPGVGQKTPVPVKGPAPVNRPAPDPKVGTFVVREDSEI
jgi:hypothetical protein